MYNKTYFISSSKRNLNCEYFVSTSALASNLIGYAYWQALENQMISTLGFDPEVPSTAEGYINLIL